MARGEPVQRLVDRIGAVAEAEPSLPTHEVLTGREIEILAHVARGRSNKEIGAALHISEATVKTPLAHIFGKLGVRDRTQAVTMSLDRGILRLQS